MTLTSPLEMTLTSPLKMALTSPLEIIKIYISFHLTAIVRCAISAIIYEILAIEMCMTLILTFRMRQGQNERCQSKAKT